MREVGNFDFIIDQNTPNTIQTIWDAKEALDEIIEVCDPREHYTVSTFLEALRLDVYLPSFNKAGFPAIFPEMSAAEKAVEMMKIEDKSPKTGLAFYRKRVNEQNWHYLSEIVLQNRGRRAQIPVVVPYFTTNQLKMLHRHTQIGVQKISYGDGVIGNGPIESNRDLDQITIEGDFRIDIDQSEFKRNRRINFQDSHIFDETGDILFYSNPQRAFFEIQNNSTSRLISMTFGSNNRPFDSGIIIYPGQIYYPSDLNVVTDMIKLKTNLGTALVSYLEMEYY